MPRGQRGEKRRADPSGNAVMIAKIATGEIEDIATEYGKKRGAGANGRQGAVAGMTAKRRKEIAKKAAAKRWGEIASMLQRLAARPLEGPTARRERWAMRHK